MKGSYKGGSRKAMVFKLSMMASVLRLIGSRGKLFQAWPILSRGTCTKASLQMITCMARGCIFGQTAEDTQENFEIQKRLDLGYLLGNLQIAMKANGATNSEPDLV
jgi:hypothetical protein